MLALLLNTPKSDQEWATWSFAHRASHDQIRQAIQSQLNINLVDYQLDPIDLRDTEGFLQRNSEMHLNMTAAVGIQSHDIQTVDFKDRNQLESWLQIHWQEHTDTEIKLGIGS